MMLVLDEETGDEDLDEPDEETCDEVADEMQFEDEVEEDDIDGLCAYESNESDWVNETSSSSKLVCGERMDS